MKKEKYFGIDYLRVIACIGILMMHMIANNSYTFENSYATKFIGSFTNFVFLFMEISAFGMCCGYYDKTINGQVNWTNFYKKRYAKVLPFFAFLVIVDLVVNFSKESLYEGIADVSLLFGLFPNDISVIGVGWFLGTVFAFYFIFPFFCSLIETKPRAWCAFAASLVLNYICSTYFNLNRRNIVFSFCFFLAGGLIYLYRAEIKKVNSFVWLLVTAASIVWFFAVNAGAYSCLLVSSAMLMTAISYDFKGCKVISFISGISMEIYLSHMFIFRIFERLHCNYLFGNGILQYLITVCAVFLGAAALAVLFNIALKFVRKKVRLITEMLPNR